MFNWLGHYYRMLSSQKKLLETRVRELYADVIFPEHNLDKLFKTSSVSIPDDNLLSTQREEYFQTAFINGESI